MFRSPKKSPRDEGLPLRGRDQRVTLDYQPPDEEDEEEESPRGFWPDRDRWKELVGTFVAELIFVPLLIVGLVFVLLWLLE